MLVLSRREDESIMIDVQGTPIYVHILSTNNSQISMGVDAPRSWNIRRTELPEFLKTKPALDTAAPANA